MNIKKMSVLAVVASISMLMTACASPPQPTWKKEGVTDDDTLTALSQCKYEIRLNDISAEEKKRSNHGLHASERLPLESLLSMLAGCH